MGLSAILLGCNKSAVQPLTAAQAISGSYTAATYQSFGISKAYPINGQTIQIQISPVAADSVMVKVFSTVNGFYSPGTASTYPSVFVKTLNCISCQFSQFYSVCLSAPIDPGTLENTIVLQPAYDNKASYYYIPPNYDKGAVETILTRIN